MTHTPEKPSIFNGFKITITGSSPLCSTNKAKHLIKSGVFFVFIGVICTKRCYFCWFLRQKYDNV